MSRSSARPRVRITQRVSLVIATAGLIWAALLWSTGGFDARVAGVSITAHEPLRPLLLAAIALAVFILSGGDVSATSRVGLGVLRAVRVVVSAAWRRAPSPDLTAWLLSAALFAVALVWGTKAIGGSDSWGYMSEAQGFATGQIKIVEPFVNEVPWPGRWWTFTPLGYKPISVYHDVTEADEGTIVPFYSPGLPLLLAAAQLVGGYQAMFFVVPLLSGALVIATYRIGLRLTSRPAALLGAWLTAISPCIMFMMMSTMTDVPVAGAFAVAFWLMFDGGAWRALVGGVFAGIAIAIRPNFAPVAAIMALYYVPACLAARTRRGAFVEGALFCLGVLPGPIAVALVNAHLYGSPTMSGYGALNQFFAFDHVWPNLRRYPAWLAEAQTPVAWVGLAAVFLPFRWIWPGPRRTAALVVAALSVLFVWGLYLVYDVYDAWWFSRFILTSWPFIMLGTASVAVALARLMPKVLVPIVVLVMAAVSYHQLNFAVQKDTFNLWAGERRFVVAARMARRLTPRNSVIISGQHSGSLRFYAGRMTMHYDPIQPDWLDRTVAWLNEHGARPYLMLEDWEVPHVKQHFEGQRALAMLDHPIAKYYDPGTLYLYDLVAESPETIRTEVVTGTYSDFWAARPAPRPASVVFKP